MYASKTPLFLTILCLTIQHLTLPPNPQCDSAVSTHPKLTAIPKRRNFTAKYQNCAFLMGGTQAQTRWCYSLYGARALFSALTVASGARCGSLEHCAAASAPKSTSQPVTG